MNKMPDTKIDEIVVEPIVEELPDIRNLPKQSPFETKEEEKEEEDNVDYNMLTSKKIKELLKSKGFRGYSKLTKPNLIKLLQGGKIEDLVKPKKIKKVEEQEQPEPVVEQEQPEPVVEQEQPEPVIEQEEPIQPLEEETDVEQEEPEPPKPKPIKIKKKPIVKTTIKKEVSKPKILKKVEVVDRRPDYNPFKQYYLIN